jgi:GT2 family glycosyltransferase
MYKVTLNERALFDEQYKNTRNIIVITNNTYAGFSENQNLALKAAKGEFIMVLNDDAWFVDDSLEKMISTMDNKPNVAFLSPSILNPDGSVQNCGRSNFNFINMVIAATIGEKHQFGRRLYTNKRGLFQTYNISGSCFIARKDVIEDLGYFDEKYYFMPEDIALSELANKRGYKVYVDSNMIAIHNSSSSSRPMFQVTVPVAKQGQYLFIRAESGIYAEILFRIITLIVSIFKFTFWCFRKNRYKNDKYVMIKTNYNLAISSFRFRITPKNLFIRYYEKYINTLDES